MQSTTDPPELKLVALDFTNKRDSVIGLDQVREALGRDQFVWFELGGSDVPYARSVLGRLGLLDADAVGAALGSEPVTRCARYEGCLHLVLPVFRDGSDLALDRLDVLLGEQFLITIHRRPLPLLAALRREYRSDFVRFARTPSFLLYEIWDQLLHNYLAAQDSMEAAVETLQRDLKSGAAERAVFERVSDRGADLLKVRQVVLSSRTVLCDLVTRRSPVISDVTRGYLSNLTGTFEHLLSDIVALRELLSDSLNLHMSIVGQRTSQVMQRLTVVSVIFMPLTFLVGVYGMNFDWLPELRWRYGYAYFWLLASVVVLVLLALMRRSRLL